MTIPREMALLLVALGRAGVELAPHPTDADRLRHRPADLPPDLSARLRIHRATVLGLLVDGYAPADDDAGYVLDERLGIADGLEMATHPGSAAWLVAVGESMANRCHMATYGYTSVMGQLTDAIAAAVRNSDQTPYAIAKGTGVARSQLSRLLSGERGLSADSIERLADYLGLRIRVEPKTKTRKGR